MRIREKRRRSRLTRSEAFGQKRPFLQAVFAFCLLTGSQAGSAKNYENFDLTSLSLEELSNIEITSVSKQRTRLAEAAASVYIISNEDIRRSGAGTLPEVLRLAPNLQIARNDARNYAISARGFNNVFANKLLVLIDGRTVYTPLFSGVFWDAQDLVLDDIDRIEVISGPGATMWGVNAVNGVINIITRSARQTQSSLITTGVSDQQTAVAVRHGGKLGPSGYYRMYGKFYEQDNAPHVIRANDSFGMDRRQAGFRADWDQGADQFRLQGDAYDGRLNQAGTRDIDIQGLNLLGRWERQSDTGALHVQAYFDRTERDQPNAFNEALNSIDIEFQHAFSPQARHHVIWGAGYRYGRDHIAPHGNGFAFLPGEADLHWANVFAQDEFEISKDLRLTLGEKLEHNGYTGWESLPNLRLAWKPSEESLLWGALSRAVRAPSRIDRDFFSPATPPHVIAGGPDFVSEVSNVAEIGYRSQASPAASYSVTLFYHRHEKLRSARPADGTIVFANNFEGNTRGVELWGWWQPQTFWRLSAGFVAQDQRIRAASNEPTLTLLSLGNDPHHYWTIRSAFDFSSKHELDIFLRRVGALPEPKVPAYTSLDFKYGWKLNPKTELALIGQNILNDEHVEFGNPSNASEFGREWFVKLTYRH